MVSVVVSAKNETIVIVLKQEKSIFPASTSAFEVSQSTEKELNREYANALVIWKNGQLQKISRIKDNGLKGKTILQKFHSALFGVKDIVVSFTKEEMRDLSELKLLLIECLTNDQQLPEPFFTFENPLDEIYEKIRDAGSVESIIAELNLPNPDDCLDVL